MQLAIMQKLVQKTIDLEGGRDFFKMKDFHPFRKTNMVGPFNTFNYSYSSLDCHYMLKSQKISHNRDNNVLVKHHKLGVKT